ncbi:two-component system regulatory protein YycI [Listeria monocytogenes]|nr:two-component system regulatory protein YycI [Listeria monocytogenes]HEL9016069.1 two-component system regulatory protein YycI [Listeria monocytogenes]
MDWRKTQMIFIVTLLILNVFLAVIFFNKQLSDDPDTLGNEMLEERLKADNISHPDLSTKPTSGSIFTTERAAFTTKDVSDLTGQAITLKDNNKQIYSVLQTPVKAGKKGSNPEFQKFMESDVYRGESYQFWNYDKDARTLTFNQLINNNMVLFDEAGQITFYLDQDDRVISYEQTWMSKQDDLKDKTNLMSATDALEAVYQHGELKQDSDVVSATFGYYTTVQLPSGNVYFPVWCFEVKHSGETNYVLVNAKDEQVINQSDNKSTTEPGTELSSRQKTK